MTDAEEQQAESEAASEWLTRRRILLLGAGALTAGVSAGVGWLATGPAGAEPGIDDALAVVGQLEAANQVASTGTWQPFRIFSHIAQSIEMSLQGYPEHKSPTFKNSLGATAYSVFRKRGRMSHQLDEPIPGAPLITEDGDLSEALRRLRTALMDFDRYEGELAPHFAYGQLSRAQYAMAHVMHLNNHLLEIKVS